MVFKTQNGQQVQQKKTVDLYLKLADTIVKSILLDACKSLVDSLTKKYKFSNNIENFHF